jgi:hypothetical protein
MYANWLIFDFKFNFINKTINKGGKMHVNSTLIYLIDINVDIRLFWYLFLLILIWHFNI